MADPYTDEELAEWREAISRPSLRHVEEHRWLATLDARDAAHRQEIADEARNCQEWIAGRNKLLAERDERIDALEQEIAERDARIAERRGDLRPAVCHRDLRDAAMTLISIMRRPAERRRDILRESEARFDAWVAEYQHRGSVFADALIAMYARPDEKLGA